MPAAAHDTAQPIPSAVPAGLKLRRLEIENFKAIDKLVLDLPGPLMEDDPDVFVIGSKNGVGKTSILEACVLSVLGAFYPAQFQAVLNSETLSLRELLIRSDRHSLRLLTTFADLPSLAPGVEHKFPLDLPRSSEAHFSSAAVVYPDLLTDENLRRLVLEPLLGASHHPLVLHDCIYFHCNRRVAPGHIFGVADSSVYRHSDELLRVGSRGWIKHELLQFLMAQAGLFEDIRSASVVETATVLDELFREFATVRLSKLRTIPNKFFAFDVRVQPLAGGESFSFDALSSGQKEMITTLFLIWHHTHERPGLVLIDEPELHLNAEWQAKFIRLLFKLAPRNQYILATHSEFVFRSVQEDRRLLIGPQG